MGEKVSFTVRIHKKDLKKLFDFITFVQSLVKVELMGMFCVLGIILFSRFADLRRWVGVALILLSAFFFFTRIVRRSRYLKNIPEGSVFEFQTTWSNGGLTMKGEGGRKYYFWEDFKETRETSSCYYLLLTEDTTIIIPKKDIPEEGRSFCRTLLIENTVMKSLLGSRIRA